MYKNDFGNVHEVDVSWKWFGQIDALRWFHTSALKNQTSVDVAFFGHYAVSGYDNKSTQGEWLHIPALVDV